MIRYTHNYLSILFVLAVFFVSVNVSATVETYSVRKNHTEIDEDYTFEIIDGRYSSLGLGEFYDKSSELIVKFGIEERTDLGFIDAYAAVSATLKIQKLSATGSVESTVIKTATISYSPTESAEGLIDLSSIKETGGHRYRIRVESLNYEGVTSLPAHVYLEAELKIDRYYELNTAPPAIVANFVGYSASNEKLVATNVNKDSTASYTLGGYAPQELALNWAYVKGAEEYELEWTWVDNYDEAEAHPIYFSEKDFEHNNTRILTRAQSYSIPLIYAKGYLIYRIRAVGRWIDNDLLDVNKPYYGNWSTSGSTLSAPTTQANNWPHYIIINSDHEDLKNWQYQAVYAEEGKKKEIISYFDGSLRNRQTVTRINSNQEAIVGENIYDNQGRSAIQILPTPVGNSALKYYPNLNQNTNPDGAQVYTHRDFDWDNTGSTCVSAAKPMNTVSGASNYYSAASTAEGNWQDYVPQAEGYPFVQVEYTPDNTGRIRRQSGVGATYKIDGGHATEYYYLQPSQAELNRLFGFHVGNAARYKKNLVKDANGQVSVSYIDPQGRVVATALAGDNNDGESGYVTNLKSLDSHDDTDKHQIVTIDLLNKLSPAATDTEADNNDRFVTGLTGAAADALRFGTYYGSEKEGTHHFSYAVTTGVYTDDCMAAGVAYPFAYNLSIDLKDDCGATLLDGGAIQTTVFGTSNPTYVGSTGTSFTASDLSATLPAGAYSLHKIIAVNPDTLDKHLAHYLANLPASCLPNFFTDNRDCYDTIPTDSEYHLDELFDMNECLVRKTTLKADLMPGGQYGATDGEDVTSVFTSNNVLPSGTESLKNWQLPSSNYLNEDGTTATVEVELIDGEYVPALSPTGIAAAEAGTPIYPHMLANTADFLAHWQGQWVDQLVYHHPEYSYYAYKEQLCTVLGGAPSATIEVDGSPQTISSVTYDNALLGINTYAEAKSTDNILGKNFISTVFNSDEAGAQLIRTADPYFNIDYSTASTIHKPLYYIFKQALIDRILKDYKASDVGGTDALSLWQISMKTVLCGTDFDGTCTLPANQAALEALGLTTAQLDLIWMNFKQGYIAEKQKIEQIFMDVYAIENGFYNGFIGVESPEVPNFTAFMYYPEFMGDPGVGGMSIMGIYNAAVDATAADGEIFPWMHSEFTHKFEDKTKRFEPIYDLYEAGLPEDVLLTTMETETDVDMFEATGRCDLEFDLEYLLAALAAKNKLSPGSSIMADVLPEFTTDLYTAMGGVVMAAGAGGTPVSVSTATVGSNLVISVTNAGAGTMQNITLLAPGVEGFSWSAITALKTLYYQPNSYVEGSSPSAFKIIAETTIGSEFKQVVLNGTLNVKIGDCYATEGELYQADCKRDQLFADNLRAVFSELYAFDDGVGAPSGYLKPTPADNALTEVVGGWYINSELQFQLRDNPYSPHGTVATNVAANTITFTNTAYPWLMRMTFTSPLPADLVTVTGAQYNETTSLLTLYAINAAEATITLTATVEKLNTTLGTRKIAFYCPCDEEYELGITLQETFKALNDFGPFNTTRGDTPYEADELEEQLFEPSKTGNPLYRFKRDPAQKHIVLQFQSTVGTPASCDLVITSADATPVDVSDITAIFSVEVMEGTGSLPFTITAFAEKATGQIVPITIAPAAGNEDCFKKTDCSYCIQQQVVPLSCTDQYDAYHTAINALNAPLLAADPAAEDILFKTYTVEEFCAGNYAYSTPAYLAYISAEFFNVQNLDDPHYISLGQFSATALNDLYVDESPANGKFDAVEHYHAYVTNPANTYINWANYIADIYLTTYDLCPPNPVPYYFDTDLSYPCEQYTANVDTVNARNEKEIYLARLADNFKTRYIEAAVASLVEQFSATYTDKQYHYTLYYYDQSGNLIQTVPPKGVNRLEAGVINNDLINTHRQTPTGTLTEEELGAAEPAHKLETRYKYNSLNQLVWQHTPDGGESYFGYDKLGRLVVSQNAQQKDYATAHAGQEQFSYTRYDGLGRIIEVGEMTLSTGYSFNEDGKFTYGGGLVNVSSEAFPTDLVGYATKEEVTCTQYDELVGISPSAFKNYAAENTRNRITGVYYYDDYTLGTEAFTNATFYDYDVHGNVKELIQKNADEQLVEVSTAENDQTIKKVAYTYDLVSGNVKEVVYQENKADQFIHEYDYDADNRITNVRTSKDRIIYEQDAKYFYYDHGPLARTEIGDKKVHANDFAYTLQGWLKGVNSENLDASKDQGKDSHAGLNKMNGKDVFGYSLHYFANDYQARHGNDFLAYSSAAGALPTDLSLYNGNIREMYTASTSTTEENKGTSHTLYQYDQLNRIKHMQQEQLTGTATPVRTGLGGAYESTYSYDANGNLDKLSRWAANEAGAKTKIDEFTYHYTAGTNQLTHVADALGKVLDDDLDNQPVGNYEYDKIGQLIKDNQEEIARIEWKVTGKVDKIIRIDGSTKPNLEFVYDAMGNRIQKILTNNTGALLSKTYYIRDAQGNVMSIYTHTVPKIVADPKTLVLTERSIYGSSRVGVENVGQVVASTDASALTINAENGIYAGKTQQFAKLVGDRRYSLENHLGNVLEVVTDRKLAISSDDVNVDYYVADVVHQADYFPFGMITASDDAGSQYRYGISGMEKDDEVSGNDNSYDFGARFYNPRAVRFLSIDPKVKEHPFMSPYCYAGNSPILFIDNEGEDPQPGSEHYFWQSIQKMFDFDMSKNDDKEYIGYWAEETSKRIEKGLENDWEDMKNTIRRSPALMCFTALMIAPVVEILGTATLTSTILESELLLLTSESGKQVLTKHASYIVKGISGALSINLTVNFMNEGLSDPKGTIIKSVIEIDFADVLSGGLGNKAVGMLIAAGVDATFKDGVITIIGTGGKSESDAGIDLMLDALFGAMGSDVNIKWSDVVNKVVKTGKETIEGSIKKEIGDETKGVVKSGDGKKDDENSSQKEENFSSEN